MTPRYQAIPRTLCFVLHQHQILLIQAGASKAWQGTYNALGGHVEAGEDILASAIREIREESGLDLPDTRLCGVVHVSNYFGQNILMFLTLSRAATTRVSPNHEGELSWVPLGNLESLPLFADVKPLLEKILALKPGEFILGTSRYNGQGKLLDLHLRLV